MRRGIKLFYTIIFSVFFLSLPSSVKAEIATSHSLVRCIESRFERRQAEIPVARVTGGSPRLPPREGYVRAYLNQSFASVQQNQAWIDAAERGSRSSFFIEIENAVMKQLNDTFRDKNLVTSLTNRHKELLITRLQIVLARHPEFKALLYSDFKSMRWAFEGHVSNTAAAEIDRAFQAHGWS